MAIALARLPALLIALAIAHAVASWPSVVAKYCSPYAWRLESSIPFAPALRLEPEDTYLSRKFPGYLMNRMLEEHVPAGATVLSMGPACSAYTSRPFLVSFQAGPNEVLYDILAVPFNTAFQPSQIQTFHFAERTASRIRVTQTATSQLSMWSIAELRVYDSGKEAPRAPNWRLTAQPNPWDIQLAFDNDPVTRWRTWQTGEPGMYVEVDFRQDQKLDTVALETASYLGDPEIRLQTMDRFGQWSPVNGRAVESSRPMAQSLRRAATAELKSRGVRYLLVGYDDPISPELKQHADSWGVKLLGDRGFARLYFIE